MENRDNCKFCCTKVTGITVKIGNNKIIDNVSLHLHCNEITMIIGKNGAGKSTLIKALMDEIEHTGQISFSSKHTGHAKLTIGYVPQSLNIETTPISVYDFICSSTGGASVCWLKNKKEYCKILAHLKEFGADKLIDKRLCDLSGGELQRVLIANATMPYPELLIMDEPVSGIDAKGKKEFYKIIKKLRDNHDISILIVSHDLDYIKEYADKIVLLNKKVLKQGSAMEVLESDEFVQEFKVGMV